MSENLYLNTNITEGKLEDWQEGKVILANKPIGWSSFDVVNKIRWKLKKHFNIKNIKVGHAGTLDPQATGLLIVCTGAFTKKIHLFQESEKTYHGFIKLGFITASYDSETPELEKFSIDHIDERMIKETALSFIGESQQYPPLFSALKKKGKPLYQYARKGQEVSISPRKIFIYSFDILSLKMPYIEFRICCSKGTYIRSIAYDFGKKLHSGAYLSQLKREKIGDHTLEGINLVPFI